MKPISTAALAVLAVVVAACSEEQGQQQVPVQEPQTMLKVEPLKFTERMLANGLRVYALPDASTANVSVQVWYDVGSRDDPPGRSGFAHLFEHIMFKATRNMPAEMLDRLTEDVGGFNNASTWDDFTNYYEVVPANHLERLLWAEADRMGSLVVDETTFASERDVVKEEFRQRILAQPYGRLFGLYIAQANFAVHPYGRPGIGSIEDLDAATVADVRAFHAAYYRPDNAILVVSGNFDQVLLDKWVDRYFGPIKTPERPIARVSASEPLRTAPRELTVYEPNVPLPAVTISYPSPQALSPDIATLTVLDAVMSKGESSRLYNALVYTQQIAAEAFTFWEATRDPGVYTFGVVLSEGKSADDGVKALLGEIARMRDTAVSEAELEEAKNELVSETLRQRETAFGRATELANAVTRFRDAGYADKLLADIQAVTAADIQRVAKALLDDQKRVTIRYLGQEQKPAGAQADVIITAPTIEVQRLDIPENEIPIHSLAPEEAREKPPAPGPAVAAKLPTPAERTLPNGLRVVIAPKRELPLLSADLRILSGSSSDPWRRGGLAALVADLVSKGTKTRSATDIARQIESLGAILNASAVADSTSVSLETRADRAAEAFEIAADVARNPVFAAEEVERQRQQTLDGLMVSLRQPGSVARLAMTRVLFGDAPYGSVSSPASISAITREDLATYHAAHWRPDNAVLVMSGDVSPDEGFKLAERFFGDWTKPDMPRPSKPDPGVEGQAPRVVVIDLPKSSQAAVSFGTLGLARTDADYFRALVANSILGGGYSARLNQEIRIKRGLSYGVSSSLPQRLHPAPVIALAQTRNDAVVEVVGLMQTELERLGSAEPAPTEMAARQANLIGSFGREVETISGLADQLTQLASFDIPLERLQSYVADVSAVTPEQVTAVAARLYNTKTASLVVVGDGDIFFEELRKHRPEAKRIPIDKLNLESPELE